MKIRCVFCALLGLALAAMAMVLAEDAKQPVGKAPVKKPKAEFTTESVRGKVVWLSEALQRRYGVRLDDDARESMVALETPAGELIPIMKEDRGRGFWRDPRLRGIDMELLVRRYKGAPFAQVIRVHTFKKGKKQVLDYWCDICAIPMYELKECECCQGPIRLRERPVK